LFFLYVKCSEEIVVIGILRVVEEILNKRPNARVVINSLFPMTTTRGGRYPVISDYEDSFIRLGSSGRSLDRKSKRTKKPQATVPPVNKALTDDTDLSAAAEQEEVLRDQQAKNERRHKHNPPSDPNPIMLDGVTKTHKYKVGAPMIKETDKPLWTSIRAINKELKKFADKNDRVIFFDATELFAKKLSSNRYQLLTDRITDRGHPTEEGFRVWEDEIVKKLEQIILALKQDYPELFKPVPTWYGGSDTTTTGSVDKNDKASTNNVVDDEIASLIDDDLDPDIFGPTDDFNNIKSNGNNDKENDETNILIDPDESNNDDDAIDGDLVLPPTMKNDDTDDRP
jgi:hypothetical protein